MFNLISKLKKKPKKKKQPVGVRNMKAVLPSMRNIDKMIKMRLEDIPELKMPRTRAIPPKRRKKRKPTNKLHNQNFFV